MEWCDLYGPSDQPTFEKIEDYVNNSLWQELNTFLQSAYYIQPKLTYSSCSMQRGWNVKYAKRGKSLCTLYPMKDFFITLVVIGNNEANEAELLLPMCSEYTQDLYQRTSVGMGARWLMINVAEHRILDDVIDLIKIRVRPKEV